MKGYNPRFLKMHGKVQDIVVTQIGDMPIVRGRNFTNESNSPLQRQSRATLGTLGSTYKTQTDAMQKNGWLLLTRLMPTEKGKRPLSPQNCFVMVNSARLAASMPILLDAPVAPDAAPDLQDVSLSATHPIHDPVSLVLQLHSAADWNCPILCYGHKPVLASADVPDTGWAVLDTLPSLPSGTTDVSSLYTNKYGLVEAGMKVALLLSAVSPLGFRGQELFADAVFSAASAENAGEDGLEVA